MSKKDKKDGHILYFDKDVNVPYVRDALQMLWVHERQVFPPSGIFIGEVPYEVVFQRRHTPYQVMFCPFYIIRVIILQPFNGSFSHFF